MDALDTIGIIILAFLAYVWFSRASASGGTSLFGLGQTLNYTTPSYLPNPLSSILPVSPIPSVPYNELSDFTEFGGSFS